MLNPSEHIDFVRVELSDLELMVADSLRCTVIGGQVSDQRLPIES